MSRQMGQARNHEQLRTAIGRSGRAGDPSLALERVRFSVQFTGTAIALTAAVCFNLRLQLLF